MLPKQLRLDPKEISRIARQGKRFQHELFDIKLWWDDKLDLPKFAISISTRIDKRSSVRNKIKRKLRAAIVLWSKDKLRMGSYLFIIKSDRLKDMKHDSILEILRELKF